MVVNVLKASLRLIEGVKIPNSVERGLCLWVRSEQKAGSQPPLLQLKLESSNSSPLCKAWEDRVNREDRSWTHTPNPKLGMEKHPLQGESRTGNLNLAACISPSPLSCNFTMLRTKATALNLPRPAISEAISSLPLLPSKSARTRGSSSEHKESCWMLHDQ